MKWNLLHTAVTGLIVLLAGEGAALAQDRIEQLKQNGAVLAIADAAPWMQLDASGTPVGIGPDVDRAILESMGITKITGEVMDYGAMIPSLVAKRTTLSSSGGLYIKPERCENVIFSDPMGCTGEAFILPVALVDKVKSYKDVFEQKLRLGVCGGCYEQTLATNAGIPADLITVFPDATSGLKLLTDGRIDVFAHDSSTADDLQKRLGDPNVTQMIRVADTQLSCAGAAFNKEDVALRDAYNEGRKKIIASGQFMEILKKYGQEETAKGMDDVTTAQLCTK